MQIATDKSSRRRRRLALVIDLAALLAISLTCGLAFGIDCYTDQLTGKRVCDVPPDRSHVVAAPLNDGGANSAVRVTAVDREVPLPPGATSIQDSGTGTLIYDDGQRAIVLSCFHNFRNSSPPYRVYFSGRWREARLFDFDAENDLAALETAGGTGATPVQVYDGPLPAEVCGCGFGGVADGYVYRRICGLVTSTAWSHLGFRGFTGQVRTGDSGGPVLTEDGRLVGVLWGNNIEYSQVMFTCDHPFAAFLDRILPGRPGRVLPHAKTGQYAKPNVQRLPATTPAARPSLPTQTAATPAPAGSNTSQPMPPEVPPARLPAITPPDVPPLDAKQGARSEAAVPPERGANPPSVDSPSPQSPAISSPVPSPLDAIGIAGLTRIGAMIGLGGGVAGLIALPAWALVKWGARREAKRIKDRLNSAKQGSSTGASGTGPAGDPTEETFHFTQQTNASEPLERDTSEGEELLRLSRREGSDPVQDAIAGRLVRDRLETLAESRNDSSRASFARDLLHELDREFNKICPTKLKASV